MRLKKLLSVLFILLIIPCLTGCGSSQSSREDIINHVKKSYGIRNFDVSKKPEIVRENVGEENLWTVTDNDENLIFYVLDKEYDGLLSTDFLLDDNYSSVLYKKYYKTINNIENITYKNLPSVGKKEDIQLVCNYKNKSEIDKCYDSLETIYNFFNKKVNNLLLQCDINYDFEKRNLTNYEITSADSWMMISDFLKTKEISKRKNRSIYKYYLYGLANQVDETLNEMSEEDKKSVLEDKETFRICKADEKGNVIKTYDNIVMSHGSGITINSLYFILKDEGFNVSGNAHNYTVVYGDKTYEFSDNFYDDTLYTEDGKNIIGYYYKVNGEKTMFKYYYFNGFSIYDMKALFNLYIKYISNSSS